MNSWLILDKPLGLTSTQALSRVKRLLKIKKAGHAGTLDPLASGILPIALGEATKTIPFVQDATKEYEFTIAFGRATDTEDAEGKVIENSDVRPALQDIENILPRFTGAVTQIPPRYAAIKINGERAYDLARAGIDFEMKTRMVEIFELKMLKQSHVSIAPVDNATLSVRCGKGTYVRSLARDIAAAVGTVGHVSYLRRTRVGRYGLAQAISLDNLEALPYEDRAKALLPFATALDDIPVLAVDVHDTKRLRQGQAIPKEDEVSSALHHVTFNGDSVGLIEARENYWHPVRIFNL